MIPRDMLTNIKHTGIEHEILLYMYLILMKNKHNTMQKKI